jgi:hypothetical protein
MTAEPEWLRELRDQAHAMMDAADRSILAAQAAAEGLVAQAAVRVKQIDCHRCYGDMSFDTARLLATLGKAACTCPEPCTRPVCQAPDLLADLDTL